VAVNVHQDSIAATRISGDDRVLGQGLESLSIVLDDRDGDESRLAGLDVPHDPGLSGVSAADYLAADSILQFRGRIVFGIHREGCSSENECRNGGGFKDGRGSTISEPALPGPRPCW